MITDQLVQRELRRRDGEPVKPMSSKGHLSGRFTDDGNATGCHAFVQVPVIVAEICAQSVDVQDQSHGDAQHFCEHLCVSNARRRGRARKKGQINETKTRRCWSQRVRRKSRRAVFPLSPRLCQDVTGKTSRFPPSIILARVRKVNNPSAAASLTHVESELDGSFILLRLWPRNNRRASAHHTPSRRGGGSALRCSAAADWGRRQATPPGR